MPESKFQMGQSLFVNDNPGWVAEVVSIRLNMSDDHTKSGESYTYVVKKGERVETRDERDLTAVEPIPAYELPTVFDSPLFE